jgi:hypothetical protein
MPQREDVFPDDSVEMISPSQKPKVLKGPIGLVISLESLLSLIAYFH